MYIKKAICNVNSNWLPNVGVFRMGPYFFRQQFGIVISKTFSSSHVKILGKVFLSISHLSDV